MVVRDGGAGPLGRRCIPCESCVCVCFPVVASREIMAASIRVVSDENEVLVHWLRVAALTESVYQL